LKKIQNSEIQATPQNHNLATYCTKIEKKDGEISPSQESAESIYNTFRAYIPWP
jgi:methionyl-tRNA formyltransferase